jgi:hypothetical protein
MAHFAKIGIDNKVLSVSVVDNINCVTIGGIEKESIGVEFLKNTHGHETWVQCSYWAKEGIRYEEDPVAGIRTTSTAAFRGNFPSAGWYWDSTNEIFYPPRPLDKDGESCESWTLNTTTGVWSAPLTEPELTDSQLNNGEVNLWDESAYQADNTTGWTTIVE